MDINSNNLDEIEEFPLEQIGVHRSTQTGEERSSTESIESSFDDECCFYALRYKTCLKASSNSIAEQYEEEMELFPIRPDSSFSSSTISEQVREVVTTAVIECNSNSNEPPESRNTVQYQHEGRNNEIFTIHDRSTSLPDLPISMEEYKRDHNAIWQPRNFGNELLLGEYIPRNNNRATAKQFYSRQPYQPSRYQQGPHISPLSASTECYPLQSYAPRLYVPQHHRYIDRNQVYVRQPTTIAQFNPRNICECMKNSTRLYTFLSQSQLHMGVCKHAPTVAAGRAQALEEIMQTTETPKEIIEKQPSTNNAAVHCRKYGVKCARSEVTQSGVQPLTQLNILKSQKQCTASICLRITYQPIYVQPLNSTWLATYLRSWNRIGQYGALELLCLSEGSLVQVDKATVFTHQPTLSQRGDADLTAHRLAMGQGTFRYVRGEQWNVNWLLVMNDDVTEYPGFLGIIENESRTAAHVYYSTDQQVINAHRQLDGLMITGIHRIVIEYVCVEKRLTNPFYAFFLRAFLPCIWFWPQPDYTAD